MISIVKFLCLRMPYRSVPCETITRPPTLTLTLRHCALGGMASSLRSPYHATPRHTTPHPATPCYITAQRDGRRRPNPLKTSRNLEASKPRTLGPYISASLLSHATTHSRSPLTNASYRALLYSALRLISSSPSDPG